MLRRKDQSLADVVRVLQEYRRNTGNGDDDDDEDEDEDELLDAAEQEAANKRVILDGLVAFLEGSAVG